jgi:hypothetical protein
MELCCQPAAKPIAGVLEMEGDTMAGRAPTAPHRTVFVRLLNEGTTVLRPVKALYHGGNRYVLIRPADYDAMDEQWEFPPGAVVECQLRHVSGEELLVADARVS